MSARDDLLAHLQGGVTTLARAWEIRRRDGLRLGFTDHDGDLVIEGEVFVASTGMAAKALQHTTGLSVDNTEAVGALSDAAIDEADLIAGRFDGAEVRVWLVNWADPAQNMLEFRGTFGEVTRAGGAFKVDLRGLTEALNAPQGRVYQRGCSAVLGDSTCRINMEAASNRAAMTVAAVRPNGDIELNGTAVQVDAWFQLGRFIITSGAAIGLTGMIKQDRRRDGGRRITLWQDLPAPLSVGDTVTLEVGCDRHADTCRTKFANLQNFQGFPHIPGEDWQISYPNDTQLKDGGSLFS
jgi:uncharacterized phage protein (TIGR02218 family)